MKKTASTTRGNTNGKNGSHRTATASAASKGRRLTPETEVAHVAKPQRSALPPDVEREIAAVTPPAGPRGRQSDIPLRKTMSETFIDERDDVLGVINELEDQLDRYEEIRDTLERELADHNEQLKLSRQRVQELEWQVQTLQSRVDASDKLREEIAGLEEELADANQRTARLSEQAARQDKEFTELQAELKSASKQLEEMWSVRKERDGLRSDIKTLRTRFEQVEAIQRELTDERGGLLTKLKDSAQALEEARQVRNQLETDLRASEDRNAELRRVQEALDAKLEALRAEKKQIQTAAAKLERENTRLMEHQQFLECELSSTRSMSRNAEAALAGVKKAFAEVRVALAETKARARRRSSEGWPRSAGSAARTATSPTDDFPTEKLERLGTLLAAAEKLPRQRSEAVTTRSRSATPATKVGAKA